MKQLMSKLIILIVCVLCFSVATFAVEADISVGVSKIEQSVEIKNALFKRDLNNAIEKFEKLNIEAAHSDFVKLMEQNNENDYYLLLIGDKTAELGFFDLSALAFSKVKDIDISTRNIEETKKMYYPRKVIKKSDLLLLAEIYSNLKYNDSAEIAVSELKAYDRLLKEYDYANYVLAYGYYLLNKQEDAKQYINDAIKNNPDNINYKILKALIYSNEKKGKVSKKILADINSSKVTLVKYQMKINSANDYLNYVLSADANLKNYYLGRYYLTGNDNVKAIRYLQGALGKDKKVNSAVYSYLSRCYLAQNDYEKAAEMVQKCLKLDANNSIALISQGDLAIKNGDYKSALKCYKSVSDRINKQEVLEKISMTYSGMGESKKSNEVVDTIIKNYDSSYLGYYKKSTFSPKQEIQYLKLALALNMDYCDCWIDLARVMIDSGNLNLAKNYLSVANYIDNSNNFRYYYYQNLLKEKEIELNKNTIRKDKGLHKVANEI